MTERIETIIVGGGQAGLALSYYLAQAGREHFVLEQAEQPGEAWRNQRWDSFTLVTQNWQFQMPGAEYSGDDPEGFLPRDQIVAVFEQYVQRYDLPVRYRARAGSIEPAPGGKGYRVENVDLSYRADNVVVATGLYQGPKIPAFAASLPPEVLQLHSGQYRNPQSLPPGAVLVVGSAQSGCQIAEELYQSGRQVYLCVGKAGRVPRRYRGRDIGHWLYEMGFFDRTADKLPSPQARFAGNPHLTGKGGGHTINLHQFARDGVILLGRIEAAQDGRISLAPDLKANLAAADQFEAEVVKMIDEHIRRNGLQAPEEELPRLSDGFQGAEVLVLDLRAAGITSLIWACGYTFDYSLVKLPVLDPYGFPLQQRGVTAHPGLYFLGMPWLHKWKSGLLLGVGEDAAYLASYIESGPHKL